MPSQGQEPANTPVEDFKRSTNLIIALSQALGTMLELWWRKSGTIGVRYFGGHALLGFILFWVIAVFACDGGRYDVRPAIGFWVVTLGMLVIHRIRSRSADRAGVPIHSRYNGVSIFWKEGMSEFFAKGVIEPLVTVIVAFLIGFVSPPLSTTLFVCAFAHGIANLWDMARFQSYQRNLRDQVIEQQQHWNQPKG